MRPTVKRLSRVAHTHKPSPHVSVRRTRTGLVLQVKRLSSVEYTHEPSPHISLRGTRAGLVMQVFIFLWACAAQARVWTCKWREAKIMRSTRMRTALLVSVTREQHGQRSGPTHRVRHGITLRTQLLQQVEQTNSWEIERKAGSSIAYAAAENGANNSRHRGGTGGACMF